MMRHFVTKHEKEATDEEIAKHADKTLKKKNCVECGDLVAAKHMPRHMKIKHKD